MAGARYHMSIKLVKSHKPCLIHMGNIHISLEYWADLGKKFWKCIVTLWGKNSGLKHHWNQSSHSDEFFQWKLTLCTTWLRGEMYFSRFCASRVHPRGRGYTGVSLAAASAPAVKIPASSQTALSFGLRQTSLQAAACSQRDLSPSLTNLAALPALPRVRLALVLFPLRETPPPAKRVLGGCRLGSARIRSQRWPKRLWIQL